MKKGGGKRKGSAFERKIAKDIVKAFRKFGIEQRECWRSVNSGGHEIACGDLEMSDRLMKLFPYSVECKHRKKIKWQNFMMGPNGSEEQKWIRQAKDGAKKLRNMYPILVMKENFGPTLVLPCGGYELDWVIGRLVTWTQLLKNAVKEANSHKGKAA
jgi:hypothetical protein